MERSEGGRRDELGHTQPVREDWQHQAPNLRAGPIVPFQITKAILSYLCSFQPSSLHKEIITDHSSHIQEERSPDHGSNTW